MPSHKRIPTRLRVVSATIEPEPSEEERAAILAALAGPAEVVDGWAAASLLEGVEDGELDP